MKVKLKSKRVIKRMLAQNAWTHGIAYSNLLNLQSKLHSGCRTTCTGNIKVPHPTNVNNCWYVPKHFIGKVVRN